MTNKTLEWLNQNRFRAYPFVNDEGLVVKGKRIPDCVLIDCIVVDTRHMDSVPDLVFTRIHVSESGTSVSFNYAGNPYEYTIQPGEHDEHGADTVTVCGSGIYGIGGDELYIKFVFSSHEYIVKEVGYGTWDFVGRVLPTKVVSVAASGVSGIRSNGSYGVDGFDEPLDASGDVHLVDGYRTQPVIQDGNVVVKVGPMYGEDPCNYHADDADEADNSNCDNLLLFFCGQNGTTSGNVSIEGGPGVTVRQGESYTAKEDIIDTYGEIGIAAGEEIPCVEIIASTDLMNIYRPTAVQEDSSSLSSSGSSPENGE